MNKETTFKRMMRSGNLSEADLPQWLQEAIKCHNEAAQALLGEPDSRRAELEPVLVGSDAVISAHIERLLASREPTGKADKLKLMKIKAMAVKMLLHKA